MAERADHTLEWMRRLDEKFDRQIAETSALRQEVHGLRLLVMSDMKHREVDASDLAEMRARIERRLDLVP